MSIRHCELCRKRLGSASGHSLNRPAIISLRLLYGDADEARVDDCAIMCASCAGDAWEAVTDWLSARRAEGVRLPGFK